MTFRVRFHPAVRRDLDAICKMALDSAGPEIARAKIDEILQTIGRPSVQPHIGSLRHDIALGLHAIPAASKGVVAFIVDDLTAEVLIYAATYGGADWVAQTRMWR